MLHLSHFVVKISDVQRRRLERGGGGDHSRGGGHGNGLSSSSCHDFYVCFISFLMFISFGNLCGSKSSSAKSCLYTNELDRSTGAKVVTGHVRIKIDGPSGFQATLFSRKGEEGKLVLIITNALLKFFFYQVDSVNKSCGYKNVSTNKITSLKYISNIQTLLLPCRFIHTSFKFTSN